MPKNNPLCTLDVSRDASVSLLPNGRDSALAEGNTE